MGKLVLTRRRGESVKLTANGKTWLLRVRSFKSVMSHSVTLSVAEGDSEELLALRPGESYHFAGGSVSLRPHKRTDQAILAFDFPPSVHILRTELG